MTNATNTRRSGPRSYTAWEWTRAYLVLALCLPFFPLMMLASGRTLPTWVTRKLLQAHERWTQNQPMDFRIPPDTAIPAYMERWWRVPRNWALNCYYHIVMRSDDDRALHDHPWWSFSIVVDGGYFEHEIMEGGVHKRTWFGPGAMRFRWTGRKAHRLELENIECSYSQVFGRLANWPAERVAKIHRTEHGTLELPARTIFLTGPVLRRWGFHHPQRWVDAYEWDAFCEANGVNSMRMDGGSDAVVSDRNNLKRN